MIFAVHIPKTIDNDLMVNDHTPGHGSAASSLQGLMGVNLDNRALPDILRCNGQTRRLDSCISDGTLYPDDGSDDLPERPFDTDKFLKDVKNAYDKYGRRVIAVSEGIQDAEGNPIITKLTGEVERMLMETYSCPVPAHWAIP